MKHLILLVISSLMIGTVAAQEEILKGRLVTRVISGTLVEVPGVEGLKVGTLQVAGLAIFEDGRIADKQYVLHMDNRGAEGNYSGYSTYTFQNSDSITLKFAGGWGPKRNGGDYEVLSGTGTYQGVSGTGSFDAIKEPWKKANLYDLMIKVKR